MSHKSGEEEEVVYGKRSAGGLENLLGGVAVWFGWFSLFWLVICLDFSGFWRVFGCGGLSPRCEQ